MVPRNVLALDHGPQRAVPGNEPTGQPLWLKACTMELRTLSTKYSHEVHLWHKVTSRCACADRLQQLTVTSKDSIASSTYFLYRVPLDATQDRFTFSATASHGSKKPQYFNPVFGDGIDAELAKYGSKTRTNQPTANQGMRRHKLQGTDLKAQNRAETGMKGASCALCLVFLGTRARTSGPLGVCSTVRILSGQKDVSKIISCQSGLRSRGERIMMVDS
ncbi:hypothetical protein BDP81DRAFT_214204 [Colletotrichum phormii]|uniref:Uncharacterized protein n=1 Tax=Colletotrichum phormii TaxID=359342 RepID=A0AAJ0EG76_9PEZI|nr:uncharacterized protein BDP81DRAFT_214204 [Colletotrichum phormii]KAK1637823.1 hypothetical protein BDP81DRAFT_214204 [Colletotrichum phormii]